MQKVAWGTADLSDASQHSEGRQMQLKCFFLQVFLMTQLPLHLGEGKQQNGRWCRATVRGCRVGVLWGFSWNVEFREASEGRDPLARERNFGTRSLEGGGGFSLSICHPRWGPWSRRFTPAPSPAHCEM